MRGLLSLLDVTTDGLKRLTDETPASDVLAGRVVAVLLFAHTSAPEMAWLAAAGRLGATTVRAGDLPIQPGDDGECFAACVEAARWADTLVVSHRASGFSRAVAAATGATVVNAGEPAGEDPVAGLSLLAGALRAVAADDSMPADSAPRAAARLRVAVCGDLRASAAARALLGVLAALDANVLLVPARGRELPEDQLARLSRVAGLNPVRFEARSMRSLLDMVDTVLLTPDAEAQLPLFDDVGVPPGEAARRARREVEDTDVLFVASRGGADRMVVAPFRGRGGLGAAGGSVLAGADSGAGADGSDGVADAHRVRRIDLERVLAYAVASTASVDPSASRYRSPLGLRCRDANCVGNRLPDLAPPDFVVLGGGPGTGLFPAGPGHDVSTDVLECAYCGARAEPGFVASSETRRFHARESGDAGQILERNRVLFRTRGEALTAGFEPSLRLGGAGDADLDAASSASDAAGPGGI